MRNWKKIFFFTIPVSYLSNLNLNSRYLVDNHWFKQLKKYVGLEGANYDSGGAGLAGDESANPGPIDNKPLFKEDGSEIRDHMIDELDYALLPEEAWTLVLNRSGSILGSEMELLFEQLESFNICQFST